jgi:hypothetical protein
MTRTPNVPAGPDPLDLIAEVCEAAAAGDLEQRLPILGDSERQRRAREAVNNLLDGTDAFVREAGAALEAAAAGRFHRRFLTRGTRGAFRGAAAQISESTVKMCQTAARVDQAAQARLSLADELESAVLTVSEQVATAA